MPLRPNEIARIADLVRPRIQGGAIQKIRQPDDETVVLEIYAAEGGKTRLLVSLRPRDPGLWPSSAALENPPEAKAFCLALRKLLENGRVRAIEALRGDRVVILDVDRMEDGVVAARRLVCEAIPHHPVLLVLDRDDVILAASGSLRSERRTLVRGERWTPPPPPPFDDDRAPFDGGDPEAVFAARDAELAEVQEAGGADRGDILRAVTKAVKRQAKRVAKVQEDLRRCDDADELLRQGELLKASLHEVKRGADRVRVRDWLAEDEAWVEIPLDATLSPQDNVAALFRRAKKRQRGRDEAAERLAEQTERLARLNDLETRVTAAGGAELAALADEARALEVEIEVAPKKAPVRREKVEPRKPYWVYVSKDGIEIRVGRSSRENDELTFKHARGNEWWLHAQDHAGSHVVVKTEDELPEQTLLDAATLAVKYSKANTAGRQGVSWTRRKFVTKFRGAAPGKVQLQSHKSILVRIEPERLARLEDSRR